jgi:hypothetical protein
MYINIYLWKLKIDLSLSDGERRLIFDRKVITMSKQKTSQDLVNKQNYPSTDSCSHKLKRRLCLFNIDGRDRIRIF